MQNLNLPFPPAIYYEKALVLILSGFTLSDHFPRSVKNLCTLRSQRQVGYHQYEIFLKFHTLS